MCSKKEEEVAIAAGQHTLSNAAVKAVFSSLGLQTLSRADGSQAVAVTKDDFSIEIDDPDGNRLEVSCGQVMSVAFADAFQDSSSESRGPELLGDDDPRQSNPGIDGDDR